MDRHRGSPDIETERAISPIAKDERKDIEESLSPAPGFRPSKKELLKEWLISRTTLISESVGKADVYNRLSDEYVAEDCIFDYNYGTHLKTKDEHTSWISKAQNQYPEWQHIVTGATADIYSDETFASVHMHTKETGVQNDVSTPHYVVWEWKKREGKWQIVRLTACRTPPMG